MAIQTGPVQTENPTPQTLRYGLFTVANGPQDMPPHGADGGIWWLSNSCGTASGYTIQCIDSLSSKDLPGNGLDIPTGEPFTVVAGYNECSPVGLGPEEREQLAEEKLRATEQAAVEDIFSQGTFGASPSLANNTPNATNAGPAVNIVEAVSQLESNFYQTYGYPGVIHLPFSAAAFAHSAQIMEMQNRVWRTAAGTAVSIGNYAGLSPSGAAPAANATWIYITPPVAIYRSTVPFITPIEGALDRATNEMNMYAEREYVIGFDPCTIFATETTLSEGS